MNVCLFGLKDELRTGFRLGVIVEMGRLRLKSWIMHFVLVRSH